MAESKQPFTVDRRNKRVVITFTESTLCGRQELRNMFRRIDEVLNMTPDPKLVFDFTYVNHISSVFIGLLMAFRKRVDERKGHITMIGVNEKVMAVLNLTRIDQHFAIRESAPSLDETDPGILAGLPPDPPSLALRVAIVGTIIIAMIAVVLWLVL